MRKVTVRVTLFRTKNPIPLIVEGYWDGKAIRSPIVKHGGEILPDKWFARLKEKAIEKAEAKYRAYAEDQEASKLAIISRLCGTR